jgi:hypothetical protein
VAILTAPSVGPSTINLHEEGFIEPFPKFEMPPGGAGILF